MGLGEGVGWGEAVSLYSDMMAFCLKSLCALSTIFPPKHDITGFKSNRENSNQREKIL